MIQPLTTFLAVWAVTIAIVVSLCDVKHVFILAYAPFLSSWGQYYRLFLLQLSFLNESEVLLAMILLFKSSNDVEKFVGFYKYLAILAASYIYNLCFVFLEILVPYKALGINYRISAGPIGIIFTILCFYNDLVPATYKFVFNFGHHKLVANDKVFVLILATLLFLNQGFNSVIPAFNGWIIGKLMFNDMLPGKNFTMGVLRRQVHKYRINKLRQNQVPQLSLSRQEGSDDDLNNINNINNNTVNLAASMTNDDDDDDEATPARPFGTQLLDTFRR